MREKFRKVIEFLGLKRSIAALRAMVVLVGMGEKMAERFLPVYLVALGAGLEMAGILNALDNLLSALYSFPGGYLSDRLGYKRALLVFNLLAMSGYAIVIAVPAWWAVFLGSFLFLSWTAISLPATMSLVADVLPKNKRTMGVSMHSLVRRIPMALGPILGGIFVDTWGREAGVRLAFCFALALGVLSIALQQKLIKERKDAGGEAEGNPLLLIIGMPVPLKSLLVSDVLVRFCEQMPYAYLAIWCMDVCRRSGAEFGVLTAVEMATAVLVYIPVAWLADRGNKKPFVVATFGFFTIFPAALLVAKTLPLLIVAFVIRGLKEFGEPTRKALIMELAPEGRKAATFGAYYLVRDSVVSLGAFAGAYLWVISPDVNLLAASACGLAGTIWFALFGRDAPGTAGPDKAAPDGTAPAGPCAAGPKSA
ncbi:MAG: MFS transporter [Planctomycetota bacterium]|nr:MFS transporter [Planctomycetota bacterium]